MSLTDFQIRNAKYDPRPAGQRKKPNKLFDGQGLHVKLLPTGAKSWRWKYRYQGIERQMVLGTYPELSLAEARAKRALHAAVLKDGKDPQAAKAITLMTAPGGSTFEAVARDWFGKQKPSWQAGDYARDLMRRLEVRVFPKIGGLDIAAITPQGCLALVRAMEAQGKV